MAKNTSWTAIGQVRIIVMMTYPVLLASSVHTLFELRDSGATHVIITPVQPAAAVLRLRLTSRWLE
jgi:hypothetical protein